MKRIIKSKESKIIRSNLKYKKGSNKKLCELLTKEQQDFCAYTENPITAAFSEDIEHFNPGLKFTKRDNYFNWFVVSSNWNRKKGTKWADYQPILHPANPDFEERIKFDKTDCVYFFAPGDKEAENLIKLLDLNNEKLLKERQNYILGLKNCIEECKVSLEKFCEINRSHFKFRRAFEETFHFLPIPNL